MKNRSCISPTGYGSGRAALEDHTHDVVTAAISRDGRRIISDNIEGVIRI
jgi:hypothetical protein